MDAFFSDNFSLKHFLHGIKFFGLFELDAPDFSKAPFSDDVQIIEMKSIDLFWLNYNFVLLLLFLNQLGKINFETFFCLLF